MKMKLTSTNNEITHWLSKLKNVKTVRFILLFTINLLFAVGLSAQTSMTEQVYNPDVKGIENNPMKGWMPGYKHVKSTFPYNVDHFYISLDRVYTGWGKCDWTEFDMELNRIVGNGCHAVCRFWVHYPGKPSGLPLFLKSVVPSYSDASPYYNDEDFMLAMEDFIEMFGARYNGDPRIIMIEAGLYGKWGEWHTNPERERNMTVENKNRLTTAYLNAFPKTHIGIRQSHHVQRSQKLSFGYYDDSWAFNTLCNKSFCFWNGNIVPDGITDVYKYHPIGGEMRPEVQTSIFKSWPNPSITTDGMHKIEDLETCIKTTHLSFMKVMRGLYSSIPSPTEWTNAMRSTKMLGYQFFVESVMLTPLNAGNFKLDLNIQNRGVAPMYYNWQVEFSAINNTGLWIENIGTANWETQTIYPDVPNHTRTFSGKLPKLGTYKILMRFKNPLDAHSSKARVLRFANQKQDADKDGWLTLGTVNEVPTFSPTNAEEAGISIYPNPATDVLNVEHVQDATIRIFDMRGALLYNEKTSGRKTSIDVAKFKKSKMLLLNILSDNNSEFVKIIVE